MKIDRKNKQRNASSKKWWYAIGAILVLGIGAYFAVAYTTKAMWPFIEHSASSSEDTPINTSPPTNDEIDANQDAKKNNDERSTQQEQDANQPGAKRTVEVGIAYADVYDNIIEIRAFTPSVIESNGTCTATLTQGSTQIVRTSKAFIDSSSSQCEPINIPASELPARGSWSLVVSYSSPASSGTSAPREIKL